MCVLFTDDRWTLLKMNETVNNESDRSLVQTAEILLNREDQWVYLAVGLVTLVIAAGCAGMWTFSYLLRTITSNFRNQHFHFCPIKMVAWEMQDNFLEKYLKLLNPISSIMCGMIAFFFSSDSITFHMVKYSKSQIISDKRSQRHNH